MVNTFLVKMDHDCDGVSCVTYDDHHAEISRLQSEFERLRLSSVELLDAVDRDYNRRTNAIIEHHASEISDLIKQRDTAHNDAIEAAAQVANDYGHYELEGAIRALKR